MAASHAELNDAVWTARMQAENLSGLLDHIAIEVVPLVRGEIRREVLQDLADQMRDRLQTLERVLGRAAR